MDSEDGFSGPLNLGNPKEHTIKELAQKIIKLVGSNSKIVYKNLPSDDPRKRQPDIGLALDKLDWKPRIGIEEGLNRTVKYFSKILNK